MCNPRLPSSLTNPRDSDHFFVLSENDLIYSEPNVTDISPEYLSWCRYNVVFSCRCVSDVLWNHLCLVGLLPWLVDRIEHQLTRQPPTSKRLIISLIGVDVYKSPLTFHQDHFERWRGFRVITFPVHKFSSRGGFNLLVWHINVYIDMNITRMWLLSFFFLIKKTWFPLIIIFIGRFRYLLDLTIWHCSKFNINNVYNALYFKCYYVFKYN